MNDSVVECQIMSFSKKNKIIIVILDIIMIIVNVLLFYLESENKNVKNGAVPKVKIMKINRNEKVREEMVLLNK